MLSVKQGDIKYHFWVFGMTRPGIEPRSGEPLANTLLIRPKARSSIWPIDTTTQGQSRPMSNGDKGALDIPPKLPH